MQVRAILYIAMLTNGIMEAVTNVDQAVAAALRARHQPLLQPPSPPSSTTRSARRLRVQAAILLPVREALNNLHQADDASWPGMLPSLPLPPSVSLPLLLSHLSPALALSLLSCLLCLKPLLLLLDQCCCHSPAMLLNLVHTISSLCPAHDT